MSTTTKQQKLMIFSMYMIHQKVSQIRRDSQSPKINSIKMKSLMSRITNISQEVYSRTKNQERFMLSKIEKFDIKYQILATSQLPESMDDGVKGP